jgi:cell division septation protein DedD
MVACTRQVSRVTEDHVVGAATHLSIDVPKGKVKGERPEGEAEPVNRRWLVIAVLAAVLALAGGVYALLGNPFELLTSAVEPALPRVQDTWLPANVAPLPVPAAMPVIAAPPPMPGSFSILIGTYDSARQVEIIERRLRERKLPVYMVDVLQPAGDILRRIYVGRYPTREEAERVRSGLDPILSASSRVIPGEIERMRVLPALP